MLIESFCTQHTKYISSSISRTSNRCTSV